MGLFDKLREPIFIKESSSAQTQLEQLRAIDCECLGNLCIISLSSDILSGKRGQTDIFVDASIPRLTVTSSAFESLGAIPDKHTGRGEDISPALDACPMDYIEGNYQFFKVGFVEIMKNMPQ